jgi:hypothetical protein
MNRLKIYFKQERNIWFMATFLLLTQISGAACSSLIRGDVLRSERPAVPALFGRARQSMHLQSNSNLLQSYEQKQEIY